MIIAHIKPSSEQLFNRSIHSYEEHSKGTAALTASFASDFGFERWGYVLGLLHDLGKKSSDYQEYILHARDYKNPKVHLKKVKHAYVGALIAAKLYPSQAPLLGFPILGHHTGLQNYDKWLTCQIQSIPHEIMIPSLKEKLTLPNDIKLVHQEIHHLIRMLYSCLIDADFLDTERFMNQCHFILRRRTTSLAELMPRFQCYLDHLKKYSADIPINQIRREVQQACLNASELAPGFYSLTVFTGGGKTLSSLIWAMHHAVKYNKKRIIIAIPYTSIIVQTAQLLRSIFGDEYVLEHHSDIAPEQFKDKQMEIQMKLASENWDYPIIITTHVQLFESIFSNKPSSCRKLHNICNSVLILDEVQTLVGEYMQPIVDSLQTYQRLFGISVLFTTACQPAIKGEIRWGKYAKNIFKGIPDIHEIIPHTMNLHDRLKRVDLSFDDSPSSYEEIASRMASHKKVLCIVNTRKEAQEIFSRLPQEGLLLHLSRLMCPLHIRNVIQKIKEALKEKQYPIIRIVSTQLIETGVDIDFPVVYRQEAGLDSILQATGRCNREGILTLGKTYVFHFSHPLPPGFLARSNDARKNLSSNSDWFAPETMTAYFINRYSRLDTLDKAEISTYLEKPMDFCFASAAEHFKLIEEDGKNLIVNYQDCMKLVERLKIEGPHYSLIKELNQYTVNVRKNSFNELRHKGFIEEVSEGIYLLTCHKLYDLQIGLITDKQWIEEILIK